jgi:hypothetical protein
MVWVGHTWESVAKSGISLKARTGTLFALACDGSQGLREGENLVSSQNILTNIPTCPRCAVLHDMAMEARYNLLDVAHTT